jgi:RHS repeat-associated protein
MPIGFENWPVMPTVYNFGARSDTANLGRWMTPDWAAKPTTVPYANFGNPQSLNLYGYVENNPTTLGDPDGHCRGCLFALADGGTLLGEEAPLALTGPVGWTVIGVTFAGEIGYGVYQHYHNSDNSSASSAPSTGPASGAVTHKASFSKAAWSSPTRCAIRERKIGRRGRYQDRYNVARHESESGRNVYRYGTKDRRKVWRIG